MSATLIRWLFVISLVVMASFAVFAACGRGDDSPLSEDEYFDRLEELTILGDAREAAAEQAGDAPSDLEGYGAWAEWVLDGQVMGTRALVEAYPEFIAELETIRPPDTLRDAHALLLSAHKAASLANVEVLANLEQLESLDESTEAVWRPVLAAGEQQFEACKALEDASGGGFSCLTEGICYSDASRDTVVACSSEVTIGNEFCIGFFADFDDAQQGKVSDCASGSSELDIVPGISGRPAETPPLLEGLEALSQYLEFEAESSDMSSVIGLPLKEPVKDATGLGWYSYENGEWQRLDVALRLDQDGSIAEGDFETVPPNLIVLRER